MSNQETSVNFDSIKRIQLDLNERLLKKLNRSIVFADNQFIEWFNLTVGIDAIIRVGGAFNIKEFNSFQNGDDYMKAVFFISQPLKDIVLETIKDIIRSSNFQYLTIITNLDPVFYDEDAQYFDEIRDKCLIWMNNANFTCDIFHERFPFACMPHSLSPNPTNNSSYQCFLNPLSSWSQNNNLNNFNQIVNVDTYQRLVNQEQHELHTLASSTVANSKDYFQQYYQNFTPDDINELKSLSYSLNEMLEHLNAKEDCFSLGILSAIVANELDLSAASKQRKKTATSKVSVLLIDRNLDLSMPSLFQEETIFDKINNLLPNLNATSSDVQINLKNFLFENAYKSMVPGNLLHFSSDACQSLIEQFLLAKPKECLLEVYKKLSEVLPLSEKEKKTHRINTDALKSQMKNAFKVNKKAFYENIDLIQIVSAYCQINDSKSTKSIEFEKIISYTKVLTQNIFDKNGPSLLSRLYGIFNEKTNYTISDLIVLLIYVYSLVGEECYDGLEEENRIKKLLIDELESDAFLNDDRFKMDREFINKIGHNQDYTGMIERFFQNLKNLKYFRKNIKQHDKLVLKEDSKKYHEYKPLIKQVCENLAHTHKNPNDQLLDIEYRTTNAGGEGLTNLFKSFTKNYLSASVKNHPLNNDLLIVYFVGGITSYEFKLIKEVFIKEKIQQNVLIGSSHFYNHTKLIKYLLV